MKSPPPGILPVDRTEIGRPFKVIGIDYAGPITYIGKIRNEKKVYLLLFACSLTRTIHLELLNNQTSEGFVCSLKKFVVRRGRPSIIYSDNAKTFKAACKWLENVMKSEQLHGYLASDNIKWKFNLSRAPSWGGQFERLIGLVKQSLYKTIGKANLQWHELKQVILDRHNTQQQPLMYVEDDMQFSILTPNVLIYKWEIKLVEQS